VVARFPKLTEPRWLGLIMAFGAGALISAVTTDLVVEAYHEAGRAPTGVGLFGGAVGYYALTRWLDRRAERADRGARCRAARSRRLPASRPPRSSRR
jgi:ZIP family zinc transporter